ncbi:MAG: hypothetical protein KBC22_01465 [Candidatus Pacebacteria bacterium]|nr:hypothetical protein [Candidatus Paceibacterota bacterium]
MKLHQVKLVFKYHQVPGYQMEMTISDNDYVNMKNDPELLKAFMMEHSTGTTSSASGVDQQLVPSLILFIKERNNEEYLIHSIEREMMNVEPILVDKHVRNDDRRVISLEFLAAMKPSIMVNVPKSLQNRVLKKDKGAIGKTLIQRLKRFNPDKKWPNLQHVCDELRFTKIVIREHFLAVNFIDLNEGVEVGTLSIVLKQIAYPEQRKVFGVFPDNLYDY